MIKPKARRKNEASNFSVIENTTELNSFDPSPLSNKLLNQLWIIAERQGDRALQCKIEDEIFDRLDERTEEKFQKFLTRGD